MRKLNLMLCNQLICSDLIKQNKTDLLKNVKLLAALEVKLIYC